jgi:hypothetical protein
MTPFHQGDTTMFKTNVGSTDRILRIILGLGLLALVFCRTKDPLGVDRPRAVADRADEHLPALFDPWLEQPLGNALIHRQRHHGCGRGVAATPAGRIGSAILG